MLFNPSSGDLALRCQPATAWEGDALQQDPIPTAENSWILRLSSREEKVLSFPLKAGGQGVCAKKTPYATAVPATCYSLHLWLCFGTLELFMTHSASLHTGKGC